MFLAMARCVLSCGEVCVSQLETCHLWQAACGGLQSVVMLRARADISDIHVHALMCQAMAWPCLGLIRPGVMVLAASNSPATVQSKALKAVGPPWEGWTQLFGHCRVQK